MLIISRLGLHSSANGGTMAFAIRSALQNQALGLVIHDDLTPQA
jgi:hypothetical protein